MDTRIQEAMLSGLTYQEAVEKVAAEAASFWTGLLRDGLHRDAVIGVDMSHRIHSAVMAIDLAKPGGDATRGLVTSNISRPIGKGHANRPPRARRRGRR